MEKFRHLLILGRCGEGWVREWKQIRDSGRSPQPRNPTEIEYLNMKYTLSQIAQWVMI